MLPILKSGDSVEIIAPASRCSDQELTALKALLMSWQLRCIVSDDIFGHDLLCANTDEIRFSSLKNALQRNETKAVICARGGYGSMRLIPALSKLKPQSIPKLFIGMSDITALNLYLQQKWNWPVLHGALAIDKFSPESIATSKAILFGEKNKIEFKGIALNDAAKKNNIIKTTITGGNLSLIQASIGTLWQIDPANKIILFEEIGERAYRIDRMLEHLRQSHIFLKGAAIVFADFLGGEEPNGASLIKPVLKRFAENTHIPVIQVQGIGHGPINYPIPLGTPVTLQLGTQAHLTWSR